MSNTPPNRKRPLALSNILFGLMIIAAGVVAYLYFFEDQFFQDGPEAPVCEEGHNELICVVNALKAQDLENVELGRYTASTNQLSQPGQVIEIGETNAFLFIYPGGTAEDAIALREADSARLDPATLQITARVSERPLNEGEDVHVYEHSNFILVVVGGTEDDLAKVEAAVDTLP